MPITKSAVELFISSKITQITVCNAKNMREQEPESAHWLSNFGLSVIFNNFPPEPMRPYVINFIRRIYTSYIEYDLGRMALLELVKDGHGRWSPYYVALTHFEICISQLYMAMDSIRKISNHNFFKTGDGSFEECLNIIYNKGKHEMAINDVPIWLTNDGVECSSAKLRYDELEDYMTTMAGVVKGLHNHDVAIKALNDQGGT
jgi:hypothetical protein